VIDPDEILLQAVRGQIPADWDVFEGLRPGPRALGCCLAVAALLIGTILSVLLIIVISLIHAVSHSQAFNPSLCPPSEQTQVQEEKAPKQGKVKIKSNKPDHFPCLDAFNVFRPHLL
jgi:hypothetical protein